MFDNNKIQHVFFFLKKYGYMMIYEDARVWRRINTCNIVFPQLWSTL